MRCLLVSLAPNRTSSRGRCILEQADEPVLCSGCAVLSTLWNSNFVGLTRINQAVRYGGATLHLDVVFVSLYLLSQLGCWNDCHIRYLCLYIVA